VVLRDAGGLLGDRVLLVGGDDQELRAAAIARDARDRGGGADASDAVRVLVQIGAEDPEVVRNVVADERAVLADAGGEDDRVEPAEHGGVRPDVLAYAMAEHVDREPATLVALAGALLDVAHVVADAGHAGEAALAVEQLVELGDAQAFGARDVQQRADVDVARARAHDQPFERGHPHAGLDRAPVFDRADAGPVAEVTADQRQVTHLGAEVPGRERRHVAVAGAVEAIATHAVLVGQLLVERVLLRARRQRRVEGGVEHRDVDQIREQLASGDDAGEVGRVVERGERG
jgi:hypothetical protein